MEPRPLLDYATPATQSRLPWWMIVNIVLVGLVASALIAVAVNLAWQGERMAAVIFGALSLFIGGLEWLSVRSPGSAAGLFMTILCAAPAVLSWITFVLALSLQRSSDAFVPVLIFTATAMATTFVFISHAWWMDRGPH